MGIGVALVGLVALIFLGMVVVVTVGGVGAGVWFGSGPSAPVPVPVPEVDPAPPAPAEGGRVVSVDRREGVPTAEVLLNFSDPAGGSVIISGGDGFKAEWDGKAPFEVGPMADGRYSTSIEPSGGKKIRGKSFTVVGKKKRCDFTFSVADKAWSGGCK